MDEATWLSCTDPVRMLDFLRGQATRRKLRLFACACCRRTWDHLAAGREAVETAERQADGEREVGSMPHGAIPAMAGYHASDYAEAAAACANLPDPYAAAAYAAAYAAGAASFTRAAAAPAAARAAAVAGRDAERAAQCDLLRDLFGNPFRPVALDCSWLTPAVLSLAQAARDERALPSGLLDPVRLAVLADALEDAGCTAEEILGHLRGPGPHTRGCWPVDLVLERK